MHATRYDSDAPPDAEPLDTALAADNDNDTLLEAGESPIVPRGLLPRTIARRDWITAALFIASNGLTAWAWTHPRHAPQSPPPPPPVTRVEVAAPVPVAPPAPAPLVVPDLPPAPTPPADAHTREHRPSRASAPSAPEPAEPSPQASPRAAAAPEPEAEPTDEPTAAASSAGLDEALERASSEHGGEVDACIDAADDEVQGSLTVRIVIAPDGAVRSATPHGPALLRSVGRCIAGAIRGWRVEVPGARADLTATLPFVIESNEE